MDADINLWVIEFLARQPIPHLLLSRILTSFHVSVSATNNPRFKKAISLRFIQDEIATGSSSETILELLETIEDLDRKEKLKISESMKVAYCAVAVDCTLKYLSDRGPFFEAVKRIWRERIDTLEASTRSELVTDELREVKEEIEAALWDSNACKRLLRRVGGNESVRLVTEYLKEAMDMMGPSFLELAARAEREKIEKENCGYKVEAEEGCKPNSGPKLVAADGSARQENEIQDKDIIDTCFPKRPGGIRDSEKIDMDDLQIPTSKFNPLSTPEVTKAKEALKYSSMELKALVKDPLPNAIDLSNALVAEMERKALDEETSVENQNEKDADAPNPVPSVETHSVSVIQTMKTNAEIPISSQQILVPKCSLNCLMERNSTACTFEWDNSIDGLPEETGNCMNKFPTDSSRKKAVSPLKNYDVTKFTRRRKMKRWSVEEEDALREGVQKFGKGSWKLILNSKRNVFIERTEVDLKDKWRNMMK